jgi:hypothetical protein
MRRPAVTNENVSTRTAPVVIPAKAGIQCCHSREGRNPAVTLAWSSHLDPRPSITALEGKFRGDDDPLSRA